MKHTAIFALVTMVSAISGCDFSYEDEAVKNRNETLSKEWTRVNVSGRFSYEDESIGVSGVGGAERSNTFLAGFETIWRAGDRTGLFSPQALTAPGAAPGSSNRPFTAATSAQSSQFSGEMYWGSGLHDFYAYYPYSSESAPASGNSASEINVNVSLPTNQFQSGDNADHVANYDFMVASPLRGISSEHTSQTEPANVSFRFHHLFSLLVFQFSSSFISGDIVSLKLTSHGTPISLDSGTVDISQPSPAEGERYSIKADSSPSDFVITLTELSENCNVTSFFSKSAKLYLVMLPGDYTSQNFTLELTVKESDGTIQRGRFTKSGTEIRRGALYTVLLNLDDFSW